MEQPVRLIGELLRAIDCSSCGITLADCTQDDMPLVYINQAFERITGYSVEETVGKNCRFLQADDRDQPQIDELRAAIKEQRSCTVVFRNYRKDGTLFYNELHMSPLFGDDGSLTHFVGIQTDVTKRVDAEGERRELADELVSKNKELEEFAYLVSHDLRAPLRQIGSLSSMIDQDEADRLTDSGREMLDLMRARVGRLAGLIEGILTYSRVGRIEGEIIGTDISKTLDEVIDLLDIPESIRIERTGTFPTLLADRDQLHQVFANLIGNAVKYHDKDHGCIEIGVERDQEFWTFWVKDDGPGIDPKYHEKIFGLFQTLQSRDDVESSGVGLATVKKYIELQGGRIWVDSAVGEGSTFTFTLPAQEDS